MKYVNLGRSGLKVSRLCLGCMTYGDKSWRDWILPYDEALPFFRKAVEAGITFFDTADIYSYGASEEVTGRALLSLKPRDELVIATKVFNPMSEDPNDRGLSRKHILASIDRSLKRLGTDYVDLYQIHRFDPRTPIEETMEALHDVVKAGKARYIGASSMWAWQFAKMQATAARHNHTQFVSMQPQYNLVIRRRPPARNEGGRRRADAALQHRRIRHQAVLRGQRLRRGRCGERGGRGEGRVEHAGGAGLGALEAWGELTHHRRLQAPPPRRRPGRTRAQAGAGGDRQAGGALPAQAGERPRLTISAGSPWRWARRRDRTWTAPWRASAASRAAPGG